MATIDESLLYVEATDKSCVVDGEMIGELTVSGTACCSECRIVTNRHDD
ncbi:hypothetical protein [Nitrospira sp. M1]